MSRGYPRKSRMMAVGYRLTHRRAPVALSLSCQVHLLRSLTSRNYGTIKIVSTFGYCCPFLLASSLGLESSILCAVNNILHQSAIRSDIIVCQGRSPARIKWNSAVLASNYDQCHCGGPEVPSSQGRRNELSAIGLRSTH